MNTTKEMRKERALEILKKMDICKDFIDCYEEIDIKHTGNVFEAYQSFSYFNQFVPTEGDFSQIYHIQGRNVTEDAEIAQILYRQTPPEGFYPGTRKRGGTGDVSVAK